MIINLSAHEVDQETNCAGARSLLRSLLGHFFDQKYLPGSVAFDGSVWRGSQGLQAFGLVGLDLFGDENIPNLRVRAALLGVDNVRVVPHVGVLKFVVREALVSVWHLVVATGCSKLTNHRAGVAKLVLSISVHLTPRRWSLL